MKNVKTIFLHYTQYNINPKTHPIVDCADSWEAEVDSVIIGMQLSSFITTHGNLSKGMFYVTGEVSTDKKRNTPGRLCQLEVRLAMRNGQIFGQDIKQCILMFPENHGVHIDKGKKVYLHFFARSEMNRAHLGSVGALIYYTGNE